MRGDESERKGETMGEETRQKEKSRWQTKLNNKRQD